MRSFSFFVLAFLFTGYGQQAAEVSSVELLGGCTSMVYSLDIRAGAMRIVSPQNREDIQGTCSMQRVIRFPANKALVLVNTQPGQTSDYTATFDLRRYSMPSWKLEAKRVLPGRLSDQSYLIPSTDMKVVIVMNPSDDKARIVSRFAFGASGQLVPVNIHAVKLLDLPNHDALADFLNGEHREQLLPYVDKDETGKDHLYALIANKLPGAAIFGLGTHIPRPVAIVRSGNRLTVIHSEKLSWFREHLAETGDAVLAQLKAPQSTEANEIPTGRIAIYSADTGQETAAMNVPVLADKEAKCIALWHDQVAIFQLPKAFVIVNFAKQSFKVIENEGNLETPPDLHPLWVEGVETPSPAARSPRLPRSGSKR